MTNAGDVEHIFESRHQASLPSYVRVGADVTVYTNFGWSNASNAGGKGSGGLTGGGVGGGDAASADGAAFEATDLRVGQSSDCLPAEPLPPSYSRLPPSKPIYGDEVMRLYLHKAPLGERQRNITQ